MTVKTTTILALLLAACGDGSNTAAVAPEPPLRLYLLAGQSNMAGRGAVETIDSTPVPRVFALDAEMTWGPAREPLHFDKPQIIGVGPGFAFGRAMTEAHPEARIGLIPAAVGGSSIAAWVLGAVHVQTNSRPWDDALSRAFRVLAYEGGRLEGVIWHQGESDAKPERVGEHEDALVDLVERMRREFRSPDLLFVAGELPEFGFEKRPESPAINAAIQRLPDRLGGTAVVTAEGLVHGGDGTHFDSASERELGARYARAMIELERLATRERR